MDQSWTYLLAMITKLSDLLKLYKIALQSESFLDENTQISDGTVTVCKYGQIICCAIFSA